MASQSNTPYLDGEALLTLIRERTAAGQSIRGIPFRGISMLPLLRQGIDTVEVSPLPERLRPMDLPVYRMPDGKIVMHRVVKDNGDHYLCNGDNLTTFERVPHKDMIALVTAVYRGKKRIPVTALSYRVYSALWHHTRPLRHLYRRVKHACGNVLRRLGLRK